MNGVSSDQNKWICPNDRILSLRAKLDTGWSVRCSSPSSSSGLRSSSVSPSVSPYSSNLTLNASTSCLDVPSSTSNGKGNQVSSCISEDEQAKILSVISRAKQVEKMEKERINKLTDRLRNMKRNSCRGDGKGKCALCSEKFSFLPFSTSSYECHECFKMICSKCFVDQVNPYTGNTIYYCKICSESREIWKKSGAWFLKTLPTFPLVTSPESSSPKHVVRSPSTSSSTMSFSTFFFGNRDKMKQQSNNNNSCLNNNNDRLTVPGSSQEFQSKTNLSPQPSMSNSIRSYYSTNRDNEERSHESSSHQPNVVKPAYTSIYVVQGSSSSRSDSSPPASLSPTSSLNSLDSSVTLSSMSISQLNIPPSPPRTPIANYFPINAQHVNQYHSSQSYQENKGDTFMRNNGIAEKKLTNTSASGVLLRDSFESVPPSPAPASPAFSFSTTSSSSPSTPTLLKRKGSSKVLGFNSKILSSPVSLRKKSFFPSFSSKKTRQRKELEQQQRLKDLKDNEQHIPAAPPVLHSTLGNQFKYPANNDEDDFDYRLPVDHDQYQGRDNGSASGNYMESRVSPRSLNRTSQNGVAKGVSREPSCRESRTSSQRTTGQESGHFHYPVASALMTSSMNDCWQISSQDPKSASRFSTVNVHQTRDRQSNESAVKDFQGKRNL